MLYKCLRMQRYPGSSTLLEPSALLLMTPLGPVAISPRQKVEQNQARRIHRLFLTTSTAVLSLATASALLESYGIVELRLVVRAPRATTCRLSSMPFSFFLLVEVQFRTENDSLLRNNAEYLALWRIRQAENDCLQRSQAWPPFSRRPCLD